MARNSVQVPTEDIYHHPNLLPASLSNLPLGQHHQSASQPPMVIGNPERSRALPNTTGTPKGATCYSAEELSIPISEGGTSLALSTAPAPTSSKSEKPKFWTAPPTENAPHRTRTQDEKENIQEKQKSTLSAPSADSHSSSGSAYAKSGPSTASSSSRRSSSKRSYQDAEVHGGDEVMQDSVPREMEYPRRRRRTEEGVVDCVRKPIVKSGSAGSVSPPSPPELPPHLLPSNRTNSTPSTPPVPDSTPAMPHRLTMDTRSSYSDTERGRRDNASDLSLTSAASKLRATLMPSNRARSLSARPAFSSSSSSSQNKFTLRPATFPRTASPELKWVISGLESSSGMGAPAEVGASSEDVSSQRLSGTVDQPSSLTPSISSIPSSRAEHRIHPSPASAGSIQSAPGRKENGVRAGVDTSSSGGEDRSKEKEKAKDSESDISYLGTPIGLSGIFSLDNVKDKDNDKENTSPSPSPSSVPPPTPQAKPLFQDDALPSWLLPLSHPGSSSALAQLSSTPLKNLNSSISIPTSRLRDTVEMFTNAPASTSASVSVAKSKPVQINTLSSRLGLGTEQERPYALRAEDMSLHLVFDQGRDFVFWDKGDDDYLVCKAQIYLLPHKHISQKHRSITLDQEDLGVYDILCCSYTKCKPKQGGVRKKHRGLYCTSYEGISFVPGTGTFPVTHEIVVDPVWRYTACFSEELKKVLRRGKEGDVAEMAEEGWCIDLWIPLPALLFLNSETISFKVLAHVAMNVDECDIDLDSSEDEDGAHPKEHDSHKKRLLAAMSVPRAQLDKMLITKSDPLYALEEMTVTHLNKSKEMDWDIPRERLSVVKRDAAYARMVRVEQVSGMWKKWKAVSSLN